MSPDHISKLLSRHITEYGYVKMIGAMALYSQTIHENGVQVIMCMVISASSLRYLRHVDNRSY